MGASIRFARNVKTVASRLPMLGSPHPLDETMTDTELQQQTWETYTAAWRASGVEAKTSALEASVADDCVYRDPLTCARGQAALVDYMVAFHQQVPGGWFRTTSFRAHSGRSVATWQMCDAAQAVLGEGISYGEYRADGKLLGMTGFFDVPSPPAR